MEHKRIISALILAGLLLVAEVGYVSFAMAEDSTKISSNEERSAYASKFAQTVLAIVQHPKESYSQRQDVLRNAFAKTVDIEWMGKFALGTAWKTASEMQRGQYLELYKQYLTETYVNNFAEKPGKRIRDIKIASVSEGGAPEDFNVRTHMLLADMEDVNVSYLVNEQAGSYRIRDIAIENVSLINTHRSEFRQLAAGGGVGSVISELRSRLHAMEQPITLSMK